MIKVGEHITLDFLRCKKRLSPSFMKKLFIKLQKLQKLKFLNVSSHKFEPQGLL